MIIMVNWIIRKFNDKDIEHFLDWRKLVARREKTKEYFKWEYFKAPWGPAETWIADYAGKIVGQYSTLRYEVFFFGQKMMASLSFDTGTHPDFRRQGIFKTIGDHHFKEEGNQNIHFSTGFPNENFWPGGKKFGWEGLCPVPLYVINNFSNISKKKSNQFKIKEIKRFDNEFKDFSEKFKDDIPIYLNRTKEYLNWRFVEKPNLVNPKYHYDYSKYKIYDKTGELISYLVTKLYKEEHKITLHLVDFLTPNNDMLFEKILIFLVETANSLKANSISLFINKYHPFCKFLENNGFQFVDTNRVFIVRNNNDYLDKELLFKVENHYITMGDSDVI